MSSEGPDSAPLPQPADLSLPPARQDLPRWTDSYFRRTRAIVERFGDVPVTYAVFLRRPVVSAPRLAFDWLKQVMAEAGQPLEVDIRQPEGRWVGAGEPIAYFSGSFIHLVEAETILLQKLGAACVAAHNAYTMCTDLPKTEFLAMDARHCAGLEMASLMAYAASVGSARAQRKHGARGFIGNATDATAGFFGNAAGYGTMPHALIGYAGSTVRAAEMFHEVHPDQPLTVLVDYFAQELTDALAVCAAFPDLCRQGRLNVRLDTTGGRFMEGLDTQTSYAVLDRHVPHAIRGYRDEQQLRYLIGTGVSAAAIWRMREVLDEAGHDKVRIVASSGFGPEKCHLMAEARAPIDVVGTGSFLPNRWTETYATADIIAYGAERRVKVGREWLFPGAPRELK